MLIVDVSEDKKVIEKLTEKLGKDNFKIEQIGCWDCKDKLFPIKKTFCADKDEMEFFVDTGIVPNKDFCKDCDKRKYIRFADFTNDTHSFYYERKTVFDFISSRKRRLYNQLNRIDTFVSGNKGLILEGMGEYTMIYDSYWKNINKKELQGLSPLMQVITLGGEKSKNWSLSFIRELYSRGMHLIQTYNLDETLEFLVQADEGYSKESKLRLLPKRYPTFSIERNILALFKGIGIKRSEKILKDNIKIQKDLKKLIKDVEELGYGK